MNKRQHPERRWATGVLVVSGAISLSFNTRHAFYATSLPWPLALGYGAGPVLLAAMQSHVVALQAARGELVDGWRKFFTFGLVVGALALSFLGIYDLLNHDVPNPFPHAWFNLPAVLTPIVVDLMAIAALHELLRPATTPGVKHGVAAPEPSVVLATEAEPEDRQLGDNSDLPPVANTAPEAIASERQDGPPTGDSETSDPGDNTDRQQAPERRQQRTRPVAKNRRSMDEWVELAGPIFHAEFERLQRQPTGYEFAAAIKKAKLGNPSPSTAKNIRTEILDRSPLPSLDD